MNITGKSTLFPELTLQGEHTLFWLCLHTISHLGEVACGNYRLYMSDLFNGAISSSVLNGRAICQKMNWKDVEGSRLDISLTAISAFFWRDWAISRNPSHNSQLPGRHFLNTSQKCCQLASFREITRTYINKVRVKLSLSSTNKAPCQEGVWSSGCIDPHFLDLGTSWRWVVSFTPLPLYSQGKSPRYPLDRRLSEPQSRSGRFGEEKILDPTGTRTPNPQSSSPQPVAIPTTLPRRPRTYILVEICTTYYVGWVTLAQNRAPWRTLANTIKNLQIL
jgi:hypothetical protein